MKAHHDLVLANGDTLFFHLPTVGDERVAKHAMDRAKKRGREMTVQDLGPQFLSHGGVFG